MLKNKKAIYILIPLNLLIWGFFIYRFYSAYTSDDAPATAPKLQTLKIESIRDSTAYILMLNYKDPFLKDAERVSNPVNTGANPVHEPKQVVAAKTPTLAPKQLPDIKYLGLIKNNSSGVVTALVSVNGQSRLVKQNETHDGITFKSFSKDSLVARWGKEKLTIRK